MRRASRRSVPLGAMLMIVRREIIEMILKDENCGYLDSDCLGPTSQVIALSCFEALNRATGEDPAHLLTLDSATVPEWTKVSSAQHIASKDAKGLT